MSGRECCENPPALSSSSGNGCVLQLGSFNTYVSGPSTSKLAILLVSDVYGYEAPNLRKLADKVAAAGYYVVVPDFFYGDPYTMEKTLSIWIQSHGTAKGFEDAKQVVAALKDKGISAIGAAGFCWGAKVVTELSKSDYIQAVVLLHPSLVKVDDFKEVKVPIAILAAEIDKISPSELIKQFEEILSSKPEVDKFVKIFPGVKHGWTVRYNVENKEAVQHAEEAHRDMLDWLTKYVNENRDSVDGKEQVKVIYHDNNSMNSTRAEAYKCKDISGASSPSGKLKCCIPSESKSVAFQCQKYN